MRVVKVYFLVADLNLCGGGERVALNLASCLKRYYDYDTGVLSIQKLRWPLPFDAPDGVTLNSLDMHLESTNVFHKAWSRFIAVRRASRWLMSRHADVVLGIGTFPNIVLSLVSRKRTARIGCEHIWLNAPTRPWRVIRRLLYPRLNAVVMLTEEDKARAKNLNPALFCIPNSCPIDDPRIADPNNNRVLAIGRIEHQKGFDRLISAFQIISKSYPKWNLVLVGEGKEEPNLRNMVSELSLRDRVIIKPNKKDVISEYLQSSIFALSSRYEGLPMVLIEAQSLGLPVVAFDCQTGPKEIVIDGETGFLVEQNNVELFAQRLSELMSNSELRQQMGVRAKTESQRFSNRYICNKWRSLFSELGLISTVHGSEKKCGST